MQVTRAPFQLQVSFYPGQQPLRSWEAARRSMAGRGPCVPEEFPEE